jgi:hypothetical protein
MVWNTTDIRTDVVSHGPYRGLKRGVTLAQPLDVEATCTHKLAIKVKGQVSDEDWG